MKLCKKNCKVGYCNKSRPGVVYRHLEARDNVIFVQLNVDFGRNGNRKIYRARFKSGHEGYQDQVYFFENVATQAYTIMSES